MYVAVYGAILSTILAILEVYRFRAEQREREPRIRVEIARGFMRQGDAVGPDLIFLDAANAGDKNVTLSFPALLLPDGKYLMTPIPRGDESNVTFPCELLPGRSCSTWREAGNLARSLRKNGYSGRIEIVGEYRDAVGNSYKSKPFNFDIDYWSKN